MRYIPNDKLNYIKRYNQNIIKIEPNNFIAKDSIITQDKEKINISLNRYKKQIFVDNINLLESNDNNTFKKLIIKMQENFDKVLDYHKKSNTINKIPKSLLYYSWNQII